jgi:hypothetical protein
MEPLAGEFAVYLAKILNSELGEGLETSISWYPDAVKFSTVLKLAATYSRAILRAFASVVRVLLVIFTFFIIANF